MGWDFQIQPARREVTQYPTECLVSFHKLQQEEDVIIIDEGYVSNNWSVNTSSVAGEEIEKNYNELKVFKEYSNQFSEGSCFYVAVTNDFSQQYYLENKVHVF